MKLIWLERALEDQDLILDYITEWNEAAADDLYLAIEACCQRIVKHPVMYRSGRELGTREAVVSPNYILIYRVTDKAIQDHQAGPHPAAISMTPGRQSSVARGRCRLCGHCRPG